MQAKNDFPPDISDIVFIPRLDRVVNPKSVVKVIYKRGQILKVAAESDHLIRGLSTSELVRFLDVSTCEQTFSRLLSGAVRQATDNMKRMNIDVGNDWASILEPIPGGISREEAKYRSDLRHDALQSLQASNYFKMYVNTLCLSYVIAQHNRSVRRACYIDMQSDYIPAHVNERINSQLTHQFIHHQNGSQSHFPIQTLGVPLAVNAIGDIILKYYDGNVPTFNIKGHAGMHDCYLVANMPRLKVLVDEYGSLGERIYHVFHRLYSVQAQHYAQLQARIGVRMSVKLLLQALSTNVVTKGKFKG